MSANPKSFHGGRVMLHAGDCLEVLDALPENSVDAVCVDPPYHLTSIRKRFGPSKSWHVSTAPAPGVYERGTRGFMGSAWDGGDIAFRPETWEKVLRVLKPGGHMVAFAAAKNQHRMICAIEDAGFEVRDSVLDIVSHEPMIEAFFAGLDYGQCDAFMKIIDSVGVLGQLAWMFGGGFAKNKYVLKPAFEPICLARKPISEKNIAKNILRWGTGAINVDACRIPVSRADADKLKNAGGWTEAGYSRQNDSAANFMKGTDFTVDSGTAEKGRRPANVVHDNSDEVLAAFPESKGSKGTVNFEAKERNKDDIYHGFGNNAVSDGYVDAGGSCARYFASCPMTDDDALFNQGDDASRIHYSAKAGRHERLGSRHPTVKPVALMRWLVRLVTPPGGTVLDMFAGTGTTAHAALLEGFRCVLIEREAEYRADIERRMSLVFAGSSEKTAARIKAKGAEQDHGPLFGGADSANGGGGQSTAASHTTLHRASRNEEVIS